MQDQTSVAQRSASMAFADLLLLPKWGKSGRVEAEDPQN